MLFLSCSSSEIGSSKSEPVLATNPEEKPVARKAAVRRSSKAKLAEDPATTDAIVEELKESEKVGSASIKKGRATKAEKSKPAVQPSAVGEAAVVADVAEGEPSVLTKSTDDKAAKDATAKDKAVKVKAVKVKAVKVKTVDHGPALLGDVDQTAVKVKAVDQDDSLASGAAEKRVKDKAPEGASLETLLDIDTKPDAVCAEDEAEEAKAGPRKGRKPGR